MINRLEVLYKNWRHVNFEKQGFFDWVCLPEIFTSEPDLCLNVYGNLGDMLTQKKYPHLVLRAYFYKVLKQRHAFCTYSRKLSTLLLFQVRLIKLSY